MERHLTIAGLPLRAERVSVLPGGTGRRPQSSTIFRFLATPFVPAPSLLGRQPPWRRQSRLTRALLVDWCSWPRALL
ncbi:MAG: hypothetical protein ACRD0Z_17830 [Acidimicrobiales bacterium]